MKCKHCINKILQQNRMNSIVQLWKHCYRRNKPEADQSSAPQWTFSFISAGFPNVFTISYHLDTSYCQRVPLLPEQL